MMELFGLVEDQYSSVSGVSMVPGTFNTFPCFRVHSDALLAQPTRYTDTFSLMESVICSEMIDTETSDCGETNDTCRTAKPGRLQDVCSLRQVHPS